MNRNTKVLVLGASGLLGAELCKFAEAQVTVIPYGNTHGDRRADMSSRETAWATLEKEQPDVIVNLIGHTNVDGCESSPNEAYRLNTRVVENIVNWQLATASAAKLLQVSTDQVYDGNTTHDENDVKLTNYYAFSKYAGELAALRHPRNLVCRVNFFGRSAVAGRVSFTDWLWAALESKSEINVFSDVLFSPLSMSTLVTMLFSALTADLTGIYNIGARDGLSKADFAFSFAAEVGLASDRFHVQSLANVGGLKAYRPSNMLMNVGKFEQALGLQMPTLLDEIKLISKEYVS